MAEQSEAFITKIEWMRESKKLNLIIMMSQGHFPYLIDEQTRINEQGWRKLPPCSFIDLLSK